MEIRARGAALACEMHSIGAQCATPSMQEKVCAALDGKGAISARVADRCECVFHRVCIYAHIAARVMYSKETRRALHRLGTQWHVRVGTPTLSTRL